MGVATQVQVGKLNKIFGKEESDLKKMFRSEEMEKVNELLNIAESDSLVNMIAELKLHLGMVFHRFLDGTVNNPISIFINKAKIDPWDPFLRKEDFTTEIEFKKDNGKFRFSDNEDPVIVRGFVMPN